LFEKENILNLVWLTNQYIMKQETPKLCLQCSRPVSGRADKKFCNPYCRTDYNNIMQKKKQAECIKNINDILLHNRGILVDLIQKNTNRTTEDKLIAMGFHFHFHTHSIRKGKCIKNYCYDVGYMNQAGIIRILPSE
jgi:hypothetical protein